MREHNDMWRVIMMLAFLACSPVNADRYTTPDQIGKEQKPFRPAQWHRRCQAAQLAQE